MQFFSSVGKTVSFNANMCIGQILIHFPQFIQVEVFRNTTLLPAIISEPFTAYRYVIRITFNRIFIGQSQRMQFPSQFSANSLASNISRSFGVAFIVAVHQNPRLVRSILAGKLSGYNSSFRLYDFFFEVAYDMLPRRVCNGGKYEHILPLRF